MISLSPLMKVVKADERGLKTAALKILTGGTVIYPTETVYGLGCIPSDPDATKRVCEIKGREDKPLPLICSDVEIARRIVHFNPAAEILARKFWPGPLTLVLPRKIDYPIWVTRHKDTLALRVSGHKAARRLAQLSGGTIVSTSANKSGGQAFKSAKEIIRHLGAEVDVVVDGGTTPSLKPSTILDLSSEEFLILRSGALSGEEIFKALKG
jgi:L-threonylcarbamoyladenylate synthase